MLWLVGIVLIIQAVFHWFLEFAIRISSPMFEVTGLGFFLLLTGFWLISGSDDIAGSD